MARLDSLRSGPPLPRERRSPLGGEGGLPATDARWSRHAAERCTERRIAKRDVRRILERPFVSGPADEEGVRWHVGRARCGLGERWHWIKIIESCQDGHPTLITSYALLRGQRGHRKAIP